MTPYIQEHEDLKTGLELLKRFKEHRGKRKDQAEEYTDGGAAVHL